MLELCDDKVLSLGGDSFKLNDNQFSLNDNSVTTNDSNTIMLDEVTTSIEALIIKYCNDLKKEDRVDPQKIYAINVLSKCLNRI